MKSKIKIYTTKICPYCVRAKNFFASNEYEYEEIDLTNKFDEIDALKKSTGHKTIPLIFIDEKFVGGYTDMMSMIESGEVIIKK